MRDLRRAIAPLFGTTARSKSAVSRVVTRLHAENQAWQRRSLADESIAYLYLDCERHRVRAARHVTWCSVLTAVGVRRTGAKVVLAFRVVGGEQTTARQLLLDDLAERGLAPPALVINDGSQRAAAVAAAVATFRQTWRTKWSAVVVSLDETGAGLTAFTAFLPAQWRCLRTTNAIARIFSEFRRRTRTHSAFPTPGAMLTVLWGTLATGGIRLRKLHGYRTMADPTLQHAA